MKLPSQKTCIILLALTLAFGFVVQYMMAHTMLYVRELVVESDAVAEPVNIVLISDMDEQNFGVNNEKLFDQISQLSPDLIAVAGNMLPPDGPSDPMMSYEYNFSARANAIAPTCFVAGKNDAAALGDVTEAMRLNGVAVLDDAILITGVGGLTFSIGGVSDVSIPSGSLSPDLRHLPGVHLLLVSDPHLFAGAYANSDADLILAGHAQAAAGLYESGGIPMAVTGGLVTSSPFSRPEITLVRLVPPE